MSSFQPGSTSAAIAGGADDFVVERALNRGLLTVEQIAAARAAIATAASNFTASAPGLIDTLLSLRVIGPRQVAELSAEEFGMPLAPDLAVVDVPDDVVALVSRELAVRHRLLPFAREGRVLHVAVADALDCDGVDTLGYLLDLSIEPHLSTPGEIAAGIDRLYGGVSSSSDESLDDLSVPAHAEAGFGSSPSPLADDAAETEADAPVVRLVHEIIHDAIGRRASDIHLEPLEKRFRVRYRIDGVLLEVENPPKRHQLAMISRLKIMANISIAEKRVPQDGRIQFAVHGRQLDLRVSSLPTAHGESIVMRILDQESLKFGLAELGFFPDDRQMVERLIALPDGIVLVTGPTGSGKTTTLYSCLHAINQPDRKIITVEDPVEYQLSGINQVPVRPDIGLTFASALRAMLRQAPNVVMVGEIRDVETAEIAINASLTGHLVFSTLHTNDAPGAVTRLIDIGVKPFLVATSLRAILAQRLVRKICVKCRQPCTPPAHELRVLAVTIEQIASANFARGAGCPDCNGTGFRGRLSIVEIFSINEEIQQMIYDRASSAQLRAKARALGMRTLREDGARKAMAGLTTIEEVLSITVGDAG